MIPFVEIFTSEEVSISFDGYDYTKDFVEKVLKDLVSAIEKNKIVKKLVFDIALFRELSSNDQKEFAGILINAINQNAILGRIEFKCSWRTSYETVAAIAPLTQDKRQRTHFHARLLYAALWDSRKLTIDDFAALKQILIEHRVVLENGEFEWFYNAADPDLLEKIAMIAEGIEGNNDIHIITIRSYCHDRMIPLKDQPSLVRLFQNQRTNLQLRVFTSYLGETNDQDLFIFSDPSRPVIIYSPNGPGYEHEDDSFSLLKTVMPGFIQLLASNRIKLTSGREEYQDRLVLDFTKIPAQEDQGALFNAIASNTTITKMEFHRKKRLLPEEKLLGESLARNGQLRVLSFNGPYLCELDGNQHDLNLADILRGNPWLHSLNVPNLISSQDLGARKILDAAKVHPSLDTLSLCLVDTDHSCFDRILLLLEKTSIHSYSFFIIPRCGMVPSIKESFKAKLDKINETEPLNWTIEEIYHGMFRLNINFTHPYRKKIGMWAFLCLTAFFGGNGGHTFEDSILNSRLLDQITLFLASEFMHHEITKLQKNVDPMYFKNSALPDPARLTAFIASSFFRNRAQKPVLLNQQQALLPSPSR